MHPLIISAQFAAYTLFKNVNGEDASAEQEARRYARTNWPLFFDCADRGLGRLLLRVARGKRKRRLARRRRRALARAASA
jgi:hypothetical protein